MPRRPFREPPSDSILMVFWGDGWGKSSAALGYALRAVGRGWDSTVVQFVKGGAWNQAEAAAAVGAGIAWPVFTSAMTWGARDPRALCARAWAAAAAALREPGVVVLDELPHAIQFGWLEEREVIEALEDRDPRASVIITGRDAPPSLRAIADTVTRFEIDSHDIKKGILGP